MPSMTLDILHAVYAGPSASKRMARDAGVSHRTAEKWWAALTTPRADVLLRLAQSNDKMRAELMARLGEHGYGDTASSDRVAAALPGSGVRAVGGPGRPTPTRRASDALRVAWDGVERRSCRERRA